MQMIKEPRSYISDQRFITEQEVPTEEDDEQIEREKERDDEPAPETQEPEPDEPKND
jgi:hypothetical protein